MDTKSHSKTDSFGRKVFDELQLGKGFVSRQFTYHSGTVTEKHIDSEKLKSSPTTQLVKDIVFADGRTISYEYDAEERITKVIDSVDGTTEYTYDVLGQLLSEKHKAIDEDTFTTVNVMTYDNYGNIRTKNGVTYTYGDTQWKDLLTKVGNDTISYDAQGNPLSYLGHTLTWEKGRQLKSFDGNTYTYNADGIRTSKTVGGVTHTYTLDGTKILKESWQNNTLIPLYNNEESVCGILFNDIPYYFIKNLQGDIVAITDATGTTVARYSYDAWGVPEIKFDSSDCQIAMVNPFLYRSYYYDWETVLYYLQSRYYDPIVGRLISQDAVDLVQIGEQSLDFNLFCYCQNCAVLLIDYNGYKPVNLQSYLGNNINGKSGKISIRINKNSITIAVRFELLFDLPPVVLNRKTYLTHFKNGMEKYWKGNFTVFGYKVSLKTAVDAQYKKRRTMQWYKPPSDRILVFAYNSLGVSCVVKKKKWTRDNPGILYLYKGDSRTNVIYDVNSFERVCAHELGHILGVDDLYNKSQKIKDKYSPKNERSILGHQWSAKSINHYDLEKVLTAFKNNKSQGWS